MSSAHERRASQKAERRKRKAERKQRAKEKMAAKTKEVGIKAAIKSLGRCCGLFRQPRRSLAVCRRCGSSVPYPGGVLFDPAQA